MGIKQVVLLVGLFAISNLIHGKPTDRYEELTGEQDDFEVIEKEWKEGASEIPPFPDDEMWQPVQIDSLPKHQKAFLDINSLSVSDKDFVVRYWLLIRSKAGGYMASFEGLRCATKEYIVYAYGNPRRDPVVRKVKRPKWKRFGRSRKFDYRVELAEDFFCTGEIPRHRYQIEQAIKGLYEQLNPFDNWTNDD